MFCLNIIKFLLLKAQTDIKTELLRTLNYIYAITHENFEDIFQGIKVFGQYKFKLLRFHCTLNFCKQDHKKKTTKDGMKVEAKNHTSPYYS